MCWFKKKLCILFAYRPPQNNNLKTFFEEINLSLSTIVNEYDNMLTGDLNLNTKSNNNSYYSDLCDTFDLTNLIKANTCFKSSNQTSIDVILTNRPWSFQKSVELLQGSVTGKKWSWLSFALTFPNYHRKL